ncbi:MAG: alpha/beta hydrolase, partial [Bacteroidales bacterium]|nr:alpha/beta hydrolase [Candidatus Minthousia equi]
MKHLFILALSALLFSACAQNKTTSMNEQSISMTQEWDKTFPLSEKVNHEKVTFKTQYGFTLAADLYMPKDNGNNRKYPAIAISVPFGAIKEQCSGLYAMTMAERGFITLAFDPSFTGESSGEPRRTASPDINTGDFLAAIDYLSMREDVDAEKIGIIGICGWGGIALNAAAIDPRIKATAVMTMYDMSRVNGNGYFDADNSEEARFAARKALADERMKAARTSKTTQGGGVVDPLP